MSAAALSRLAHTGWITAGDRHPVGRREERSRSPMRIGRVAGRAMCGRVMLGAALSGPPACSPGPPRVEVELIREPVTLSQAPLVLSADPPLRSDGESVRACIYPDRGYEVSGRWTVLTPGGREAQVVGRAELVNGKVVTLVTPSSSGSSLCVHPRLGGPLEAAVRRVRLVASTPIVARRIVWLSTAP